MCTCCLFHYGDFIFFFSIYFAFNVLDNNINSYAAGDYVQSMIVDILILYCGLFMYFPFSSKDCIFFLYVYLL